MFPSKNVLGQLRLVVNHLRIGLGFVSLSVSNQLLTNYFTKLISNGLKWKTRLSSPPSITRQGLACESNSMKRNLFPLSFDWNSKKTLCLVSLLFLIERKFPTYQLMRKFFHQTVISISGASRSIQVKSSQSASDARQKSFHRHVYAIL